MATKSLTILLAGASGMIGQPLAALLREQGHSVHLLVRREPTDPSEHRWDPSTGSIESGIINSADVVINLAGASIGKLPWTPQHKALIMSSRVETTGTLAAAIASSATPPAALLQASAVGYYGDRGDEDLNEESTAGVGFLADVVRAWEGAAEPASTKKTRVIFARTGLVVGKGGAMTPLKLQTALGVAGPIGRGTQWWPWISLHDEVRALAHLAVHPSAKGPYNLVGPTPAQANGLTKALARAMKRPFWLGLPRFIISLVMGEGGTSLLLASQKVDAGNLEAVDFHHDDITVEDAVARLVKA